MSDHETQDQDRTGAPPQEERPSVCCKNTALQNEVDELRKTVAILMERAAKEDQTARDEMFHTRQSIAERAAKEDQTARDDMFHTRQFIADVEASRQADKRELLEDIKALKGTDKHREKEIKNVREGLKTTDEHLKATNDRVAKLEKDVSAGSTRAQMNVAKKQGDAHIKEVVKNAIQPLREDVRRIDGEVGARLANIEARLANVERVLNINYFTPAPPAINGGYGGPGYMGGPGAGHPGYMGGSGRC